MTDSSYIILFQISKYNNYHFCLAPISCMCAYSIARPPQGGGGDLCELHIFI